MCQRVYWKWLLPYTCTVHTRIATSISALEFVFQYATQVTHSFSGSYAPVHVHRACIVCESLALYGTFNYG